MSRLRIKKKAKEKPVVHEQWIEIRHQEGKIVTLFFPSNEDFEKERLEMDPQPVLIYRRFNFVGPIPSEYRWTNPAVEYQQRGGLFLQRMQVPDWLEVYSRERAAGDGIALCCRNPQRRPEAYGPCPCKACTADRENGVLAA